MIVSHLLLILHKKIQFYIFMFEAYNVAKGRKVQGGRILSQGTVNNTLTRVHQNDLDQLLPLASCDDPPPLSAVFSLCSCFLIRVPVGGVGRVVSYLGNTWARCVQG